jgi:hypothetical protein
MRQDAIFIETHPEINLYLSLRCARYDASLVPAAYINNYDIKRITLVRLQMNP